MKVQMHMQFSYRKCKLQAIETTTVHVIYYMSHIYYMISLKKMISCHSSVYRHHNGKGINKLPKIRQDIVSSQDQYPIEKLILELPEDLKPTAKLTEIK